MIDRQIDTDGGGYVEGNVSAGGDAVMRDRIDGGQVSQSVAINLPERLTADEKLNLLVARLLGDKLRGTVGLVDLMDEMRESLVALQSAQREDRQQRELLRQALQNYQDRVDRKFNAVFTWMPILIGIAVIEGFVLLIILFR